MSDEVSPQVHIHATVQLRNAGLYLARKKAGLSQKELADAMDTWACRISEWELLKRQPTPTEIANLSDILHVPIPELSAQLPEGMPSRFEETAYIEQKALAMYSETVRRRALTMARSADEVSEEEGVGREEAKNKLNSVMDTLNYREREIINMRYGLCPDRQVYTLIEIGRRFKIASERVRQIEAKALRKLQHPVRSDKLKDLVG